MLFVDLWTNIDFGLGYELVEMFALARRINGMHSKE